MKNLVVTITVILAICTSGCANTVTVAKTTPKTETTPETMPETETETTPETMPETTPETMPETTPETMPETETGTGIVYGCPAGLVYNTVLQQCGNDRNMCAAGEILNEANTCIMKRVCGPDELYAGNVLNACLPKSYSISNIQTANSVIINISKSDSGIEVCPVQGNTRVTLRLESAELQSNDLGIPADTKSGYIRVLEDQLLGMYQASLYDQGGAGEDVRLIRLEGITVPVIIERNGGKLTARVDTSGIMQVGKEAIQSVIIEGDDLKQRFGNEVIEGVPGRHNTQQSTIPDITVASFVVIPGVPCS